MRGHDGLTWLGLEEKQLVGVQKHCGSAVCWHLTGPRTAVDLRCLFLWTHKLYDESDQFQLTPGTITDERNKSTLIRMNVCLTGFHIRILIKAMQPK